LHFSFERFLFAEIIPPIYPKANDYDKIFKENIESIYFAFSRRFIKNDFEKTEEISTDIQKTIGKKTDFLSILCHRTLHYSK
jgi:hypothetical protein